MLVPLLLIYLDKWQRRPWSVAAFCGVWSGSTLFAQVYQSSYFHGLLRQLLHWRLFWLRNLLFTTIPLTRISTHMNYSIMIPGDILDYRLFKSSDINKINDIAPGEQRSLVRYIWTVKTKISICIRLAWPWSSLCTKYHMLQYLVSLYGGFKLFQGKVTQSFFLPSEILSS